MGKYTFEQNVNDELIRFRNGIEDGLASNPELQLWYQLQEVKEKMNNLSNEQCNLLRSIKNNVNSIIYTLVDGIADRTTRQDIGALLTLVNNYCDLKLYS